MRPQPRAAHARTPAALATGNMVNDLRAAKEGPRGRQRRRRRGGTAWKNTVQQPVRNQSVTLGNKCGGRSC